MTGADDIKGLWILSLWYSEAIYHCAREIEKPESYKIANTLLLVLELPAIIFDAMRNRNECREAE